MVLAELGKRGRERQLAAADLQPCTRLAVRETHASVLLDEVLAYGRSEKTFSSTGRAEQDQIGSGLQPTVVGKPRLPDRSIARSAIGVASHVAALDAGRADVSVQI